MADWQARIERGWYRGSCWLAPLAPLGWLVSRVALRRLRRFRVAAPWPPVPVLVVGNITVGGTGKTPLVIALARRALDRGLTVVVISRGYGRRRSESSPRVVAIDDRPADVGDEPLMIVRRTGVPVVLHHQRGRALQRAVEEFAPDLVISDDGLQHYGLPRSAEVIVLDGERGLGNGRCLPAGPLREPAARLEQVDFVVTNGGRRSGTIAMQLVPGELQRLKDGTSPGLAAFRQSGEAPHAVAGIGNPQRFFRTLEGLGLAVTAHAFPDHHPFRPADLDFGDQQPVIMTEKDAIKCRDFDDGRLWVLPVSAKLPAGSLDEMIDRALLGQGGRDRQGARG